MSNQTTLARTFSRALLSLLAAALLVITITGGQAQALQPHVALSLSVDTRYNHAVRVTLAGFTSVSPTSTYTLICNGTHVSSNECTGGAQSAYLTFSKNGSNQWVNTTTMYYTTVASPLIWIGGLANGVSYTLTVTQGTTTTAPVTFTVADAVGGPTNVTITAQTTPEDVVPTQCPDGFCATGLYPVSNASPAGSSVTVSWTKPDVGMIEAQQGLYASKALTPDGYVVTVLPSTTAPYLWPDVNSSAKNTVTSAIANITLSNGTKVGDGCLSINTSRSGSFVQGPETTIGAAGLGWYVRGFDTTSVVLKGCHFARDESYIAYVIPYYSMGMGAMWDDITPALTPYGWDASTGVISMYDATWGMSQSLSGAGGGGGVSTLLTADQPWQYGKSAATPADNASGNLMAMAGAVANVVAQPTSTTDPSQHGSLRVSWDAPTSDLFRGTVNSSLSQSSTVQYRVTAIRPSMPNDGKRSIAWEATTNLWRLNETPLKTTCLTTGTSCVLTGLSEWTSYVIVVQTENAKSRSLQIGNNSGITNWPLSPSEPLNPTATGTTSSTSTISWNPPASFGGPTGATVTKYTAYMYPQLSDVANSCSGNISNSARRMSSEIFQLQTSTKELVGEFTHNNDQSGGIGELNYYGQKPDGSIGCLAGVRFTSTIKSFNPAPNGYIVGTTTLFDPTFYFVPKIADDDPRLATNYGGQVTQNTALGYLAFNLFPGGPDFSKAVTLASPSTVWPGGGNLLHDIRELSNDGTTFLALVGTEGTPANTSSRFYKLTLTGSTVSITATPVISLGCRITPSMFCAPGNVIPNPVTDVPSLKAFEINPLTKNIYFAQPIVGMAGMYTQAYVTAESFRMNYNSTTQTWGAPQKITVDGVGAIGNASWMGQFPLKFLSDGTAMATSYRAYTTGFNPQITQRYEESAGGLTTVVGSNLLTLGITTEPNFGRYNAAFTISPSGVYTTFGHVFIVNPLTVDASNNLVRIAYSADTHLHVCTSTDGPPASPSCTVGTGSDPYPIVPGTKYVFDVAATNTSPDGSVKNGPLSIAGYFVAGGPAAPTLTNLQLGGTLASPTATATFRPSIVSPGVADTSITTYTCTLYSSTGSVLATKTMTPPSPITATTNLTCDFVKTDGLNGGGTYQVGITATNSVGTSSSAVAPLLIAAAPVAPSPVSGVTSGNVTTVTFTPQSTGIHSVLIIDPLTNTEVPGAICIGATINSPSCTVSDLTPGKTYTLKACTSNPYAASPACTTSSYTIPLSPPSAPDVSTSPNDGTIDVAWPTPPSNGSVITGYTVAVSPGGGSGCTNLPASATGCTLTGLTNGTTYTVEVTVNYTLNGVAGTKKVATTVADVPFVAPEVAPAPSAVSNASGVATVTYNPSDDNGTTVSSYTFYAYDTNGNRISPTLSCIAIAPATSCDIVGLTDEVPYLIGVVKNYQSPGGGFTSSAVSPLSSSVTAHGEVFAPDAPTNVSVTPADRAVTVSWVAPVSDGGSAITSYTVQAYDANGNAVSGATCVATAPNLSCTVAGLAPGENFTFKVVATNSVGDSLPSAASDPVSPTGVDPTVAGPVLNGAATSGDGSITVTWDAPDTGDVPTSYEVSVPGQPTCVIDLVANPSAVLSCTFTGLTNGTNYTATIVAKNAQGSSVSVSTSATPFGAPGAPTISSAVSTAGHNGAVVTVRPPSNTGGSPVTGYTITAYNGSGGVIGSCTTSTTSCTIIGLVAGSTYSFRATATTSKGTSTLSAPYSLTISTGYKKVNAYIRGWSFAQREVSGGMFKDISLAARAIVAGNNKKVTVTGFANFTAKMSLSRDRAINVAAVLRRALDRLGGKNITITTVTGGNTTKFGGTVLNRVAVIQGR